MSHIMVSVRIVKPMMGSKGNWNMLHSLDIPPRSHLYGFAPMHVGTLEVESLTSYMNRLAWAHGIDPRAFMSGMLIPHLKGLHYQQSAMPSKSGKLGRVKAMGSNATGDMAVDWSNTLEYLTARTDLRYLTVRPWGKGLSTTRLLRQSPAWCSACYRNWQEEGLPLYQPLLWMLQAVTLCPQHHQQLQDLCPHCQKRQSAIATRSRPGFCTQCMAWLGCDQETDLLSQAELEKDSWQTWVASSIKELIQASYSLDSLTWERLASGLAACFPNKSKEKSQLIRSRLLDPSWIDGTHSPTLMALLELCFALNISPLQLISADPEAVSGTIQINQQLRVPQPTQPSSLISVNRKRVRAAVQYALKGQVRKPPIARSQLERRLGLPSGTLKRWFPQEAALLTSRYHEYCADRSKKKIDQQCCEVQQVVIDLYKQGVDPAPYKVAPLLSYPSSLRTAKVRDALCAMRRELGLEP